MGPADAVRSKLERLPDRPGVYLHRDGAGDVLYVGKAKSLRSRVRTYFRSAAKHTPRIARLVTEIADLEWIVVDSERAALILESNLIKKHRPRYNVVLRDDKHFPYLKLSTNDPYPRLSVTRRSRVDGNLYVGPFTPASIARRTMKMVPKYFQVATCREVFDGKRRPCLYYHLDQCLAPCAGKTDPDEYGQAVQKVKLFLQGRFGELEQELEGAMRSASEEQAYERAARHRDALATIRALAEKQHVTTVGEENQDYLAHHGEGMQRTLQVFQLRKGRMQGRREFSFDHVEADDAAFYSAVLSQFYGAAMPPSDIYLPVRPAGETELAAWLSERAGRRVRFHVPQRGLKAKFLGLVRENAVLAFEGRFRRRHGWAVEAAEDLAQSLDLDEAPGRIECFDVSHLQGAETVASMVVWEDGGPKKADYRQYNIRGVTGPDDYAAMAEAVTRRYRRLVRDEKRLPDLVLIDGGAGQLGVAIRSLAAVGLPMLPVVALAKREEELWMQNAGDPVRLARDRPALQLVQRLRDEAHRFAVDRHRRRRRKRTLSTALTTIPGIGPQRAKRLLSAFGSLDGVRTAGKAALEAELGPVLAQRILRWNEKKDPRSSEQGET